MGRLGGCWSYSKTLVAVVALCAAGGRAVAQLPADGLVSGRVNGPADLAARPNPGIAAPVVAGPVMAGPVGAGPGLPSGPAQGGDGSDNGQAHPGDIYREALRPLDVVRSSMDNWSDAELGALAAGVRQAGEACAAARIEQYAGDDLYDLVRLCALGQAWNQAQDAAAAYVASGLEPHRAQAYALRMNAQVRLHDLDGATATAFEMLRRLPYDAEVAYALRYLVDFLAQSGDGAAVALAAAEQPGLVTALRAGVPFKAVHGEAVMGLGAVYDAGLTLGFLERYAGEDAAAAKTVTELRAAVGGVAPTVAATMALPIALTIQDRQEMAAADARYGLLGEPMPVIDLQPLPGLGKARAARPDFAGPAVVILFPEWCTQCRRMMKAVASFAREHGRIRGYGVMFSEPAGGGEFKDLEGTQTWLTAAGVAAAFGATDFPFAVVTDRAGRVRFAGAVATNALDANGFLGQLAVRLAGPVGGNVVH